MSSADARSACLVLMMKSPSRSKRRLAESLGDAFAAALAERLIACALEDLSQWPGPVCVAPASEYDLAWLRKTSSPLPAVMQPAGNLGVRIAGVSRTLRERGKTRQIFIGTDCPQIDPEYLRVAAERLAEHDAVLGPALDGGVVLMGTRRTWPSLGELPWSTERLHAGLDAACREAGFSVATLAPKADVDALDDLPGLERGLRLDHRPARRALSRWVAAAPVCRNTL